MLQNVRIIQQALGPVGLHCLINQASDFQELPVVVMESLLCAVTSLEMLRQAMFGRVGLSAGLTNQLLCLCNVTVHCGKIHFRKKHCQLSPDDALVISGV